MSDVRVPREAIERLKTWVVLPADQYEQATAEIVEAALPFLRAQWEADLLSDETVERACRGVWRTYPRCPNPSGVRATVVDALRAALGSCVRSVKDDE